MTKITQFGCCRTGSTLVKRILDDVFPESIVERRIPAQHEPTEMKNFSGVVWSAKESFSTAYNHLECHQVKFDDGEKVVCTVRDPVDVLASHVRTHHFGNKKKLSDKIKVDQEILNKRMEGMFFEFKNFWNTIDEHDNEFLFLKYEDFWNNYSYIFDNLESFFNVKIDQYQRAKTKDKVCINETLKIQQKIVESVDNPTLEYPFPEDIVRDTNFDKKNYFGYYDTASVIHANHIMTPQPKSARKIFTEKQIVLIKEKYTEFIDKWKKL